MREELLNGNLPYPGYKILDDNPEKAKDVLAFWNALWVNYLRKQETNSMFWYERLGCNLFNRVVRALEHNGWVESISLSGRKWGSVKLRENKLLGYITPEELMQVKVDNQYKKYLLDFREARASKLVRQNGKTKRTGLVRKGFRAAGNTQFGFDTDALKCYEGAVKRNLTKSMEKIRSQYKDMYNEEDDYDNISVGIFDWHCENTYEVFTTGDNINDSRGRAISSCLGKVFNPISNKDARAALVITYD